VRTSAAMRSIRWAASAEMTCAKSFTSPVGWGIWMPCGRRKSQAALRTADIVAVEGNPIRPEVSIYSPIVGAGIYSPLIS
jgi:hypothetical protein